MAEGTQYVYQLDEGQVPESQNNGELYAAGEGEGAYEGEMMEEGQAGSSVDEGGQEALFAYAQETGEMPSSSNDITTSYAIADDGSEGGMVYFLTEDGVLTQAMPGMEDGTMMLQAVEGGEGEGQLQVIYQQIDEGMAPESSTGAQYVTMTGEGAAEYMEGAVGSTSMEHEGGIQVIHAGQGDTVVRQQKVIQGGRGGAQVQLIGVPSKKPATTIITMQKQPQVIGTPGSLVRSALQQTPRPIVTIATPGSVGTPAGTTPGGRCNVCKKVNCTTKHRVKFPGESKLNREAAQTAYALQVGESPASITPVIRGTGTRGRPRGSRGRGSSRGGYNMGTYAPLDTSSASDSESTPARSIPRGRGGHGGLGGSHVAEGGLQGHWLKAMHGTSLEEVEYSNLEEEEESGSRPLVQVKKLDGAAKTVVMEIKRQAGGPTATKVTADKLAAAEGKKKTDDEEDEWVPTSAKKKTSHDDDDEFGRKSHRERKFTSKFAEFVKEVAPDGKTSTAAASTQDSDKEDDDANDVVAVATPKAATLSRPVAVAAKRKVAVPVEPVTVTPSQVVLSYGKMQTGGPRQVIVQPPAPKDLVNKAVLCKPHTMSKQTMCRPYMLTKEIQTDEGMFAKPVVIPVPVPLCLPTPMAMYTTPTPYPVPLPIPVPVPCFIPLTKRTAEIILKHIKELSDVEPADPFEAELLHMAEMVAKAHEEAPPEEADAKEAIDVAGQSGELAPEDVLQIALRMASEIPEETVVDFEEALDTLAAGGIDENALAMPDAQAFLKYTFGVNAWKLWVLQKNIQIEQLAAKQPAGRTAKQLFKTELLQCTPEELNYSLSLFVREVRKPNGDEYAPDSIYYLCLGIQQYLYENGRLDNIFTDGYYDKFTDNLNEVLQRYEIRLNTQGMVVARIEEEHLWETRQLGAHSPFVLLNTLIYFNTKYFLLKSAEEHLSLSFTDIMKHWKKTNAVGGKAPGKMFFLRYFAPLPPDGSGRKRRDESVIFEQPENLENPLRCPVKLYEFYLSKCPESVRNRNDLFYLVPEKSCVPDSPVWYSTQALDIDMMVKMLSRLRIVRELQEIYLHQAYEVTIQM